MTGLFWFLIEKKVLFCFKPNLILDICIVKLVFKKKNLVCDDGLKYNFFSRVNVVATLKDKEMVIISVWLFDGGQGWAIILARGPPSKVYAGHYM